MHLCNVCNDKAYYLHEDYLNRLEQKIRKIHFDDKELIALSKELRNHTIDYYNPDAASAIRKLLNYVDSLDNK